MTEIIIVAAAIAVIVHNEWRHQQQQEAIDVVGTMVGELIDIWRLNE